MQSLSTILYCWLLPSLRSSSYSTGLEHLVDLVSLGELRASQSGSVTLFRETMSASTLVLRTVPRKRKRVSEVLCTKYSPTIVPVR